MNIRVNCIHEDHALEGIHTFPFEEQYIPDVFKPELRDMWLTEEYYELLKAFAIVVRSYAYHKILHYSDREQDLWDSSKSQNFRYSSSVKFPIVHKAVQETEGMVLIHKGEVISAYYSASNQGQRRNEKWGSVIPYVHLDDGLEDVYSLVEGADKPGHGIGLSQYGAYEMAKRGKSYKEILNYYYKDVEIVDNYNEKEVDTMSDINTKYMTKNRCYKKNKKITPKGIMIHSTASPGIMASDWFDRWNYSQPPGKGKCVHAFADDKEIWQYLPWNHRGWHGGGSSNDTHIGIEICEPKGFAYINETDKWNNPSTYNVKEQEPYFKQAIQITIELCVHLCKEFNLNENNIISHREGHESGIASNHADVKHWWHRHNYNMNMFRNDVRLALSAESDGDPVSTPLDKAVIKGLIEKRNKLITDNKSLIDEIVNNNIEIKSVNELINTELDL